MLIIEIIMMIAGAVWAYYGLFEYGFSANGGPGSGFFPVIAGVIVVLLCALDIFNRISARQPINGKMKTPQQKECLMLTFIPSQLRPLFVLAYGFMGIILLNLFGILIAGVLTCGIWLKFISKKNILQSLAVACLTTGVLYGVFVIWLRVPFPRGILF